MEVNGDNWKNKIIPKKKSYKKIKHLHIQSLIITLKDSRRYDQLKIKTESYENNQK